jgi:hypothetical protein
MDLEINPGPSMTVTGRVHGNSTIYLQPQATLTFQNHVTAVGSIIQNKSPLDPLARTPGTIVFQGASDAGVASLNLPIGTNNTSTAVHAILEIRRQQRAHAIKAALIQQLRSDCRDLEQHRGSKEWSV